MKQLRKTKIVGTIGPASENKLEELFEAGLNVCRINYSHGSWDEQSEKSETIARLREKLDLPEWYGNNFSALWDMLTGFIETPVSITVIFKPETKAAENLKENVLKIIETFKEAAEEEEIEFNCDM